MKEVVKITKGNKEKIERKKGSGGMMEENGSDGQE